MDFHPGLKLWSTNSSLLPHAAEIIRNDLFHYIELTPIPGTDVEPFLSYNIPFIIHATTERHGLNISDPSKTKYNQHIIKECIKWADMLNSEYIILHPGFGKINNTIQFLNNINDARIIIENMPKVGINGEKMIGSNPKQLKELIDLGNFGFCFDINHAIKAAISEKKEYKTALLAYSNLKPKVFHISDGSLNIEKDEHLPFGHGDYDLIYIKKLIDSYPDHKYVTLETPRQSKYFEDDIKNLHLLNES